MVEKTAEACKTFPTPAVGLSVVVPVLNDCEALKALVADLARQTGVDFEVVVSDGGSTDGLLQDWEAFAARIPFPLRRCNGPPGRGRQLNRGAAQARADVLLFLHADSLLPDSTTLSRALDLWQREQQGGLSALHFPLTFRHGPEADPLPWALLELKARSRRPWTTHGDQGLLLSRTAFAALGGYREDLPALEDSLLVERLRARGRLLLAPVGLATSGRRFEQEGMARRQALNAVLVACGAIGFTDGLRAMAGAYRPPAESRRFALAPIMEALLREVKRRSWRQRWHLWYAAGRFVQGQAWQLGLWRDYRRHGAGLPVAGGGWTRWCDRWFIPATAHPPGWLLTALLTWGGVRLWAWWLRWREGEG